MSISIDPEIIVDRYFEVFEAPSHKREMAINSLFAQSAYYCDPLVEARTLSEHLDVAGGFQHQFPGCRVTRTSEIDHHHNQIRFNWVMMSANGDRIVDGIDVLLVDRHGDVTHALGFFGHSPELLRPADA